MPSVCIGSARIEYREQGRGEPVLLLHSSGSSSAQWRALIDRLSTRFRVIAPDLYGYGASALWPGQVSFRLAHEAEIACALLGRIGEPAHVVGHSYGGATALHLARERSDLMCSLAVVEPVAFHLLRGGNGTDARALSEIRTVVAAVADALACGDYAGGFEHFVDYWSGPGAWAAVPAEKRAALAPRLAKVALDFHATLNDPAQIDDFRTLAVPTLVVKGSCSALPTRRICDLLARALPEVSMREIEGAGHMAPLTHRDEVNNLLVAHINANEARYRDRGAALEVA